MISAKRLKIADSLSFSNKKAFTAVVLNATKLKNLLKYVLKVYVYLYINLVKNVASMIIFTVANVHRLHRVTHRSFLFFLDIYFCQSISCALLFEV